MRLFGRLVSNIDAVKESIFFGFTDVDQNTQIDDIYKKIFLVIDSLSKTSMNKEILRLICTMFTNLKNNSNSYALIYPLNNELRFDILDKLSSLKKIPNDEI